jgi:hypothetical protein
VHHAPWRAPKPTVAASQKAVVASALPVVAAPSPGAPSRVAPASASGAHGHAAKNTKVKPKKIKKVNAHGRANRTRSTGHASFASRGKGAQKPHRAHPSRRAPAHKKAQAKPKHHQLPGPIGEHPASPSGHGKQK